MLDPLIRPAGLTNFTPHTVLLTPAVVVKLTSKFINCQNLSKSHSGSNKFYPTFHSSQTRCIYKISKICLSHKACQNLSKSHSGSKQAFAPHFIRLTPAVFIKLSREREREKERERNLKICLSLTAGLTKLLPQISFILRPLYF